MYVYRMNPILPSKTKITLIFLYNSYNMDTIKIYYNNYKFL